MIVFSAMLWMKKLKTIGREAVSWKLLFKIQRVNPLRVHPRKDQAGAAQAISPISMKLGQFEAVDPKLLLSNFKEIWSKPGGVDHPLCFFTKMTKKSPNN